MSNKFTYRFTRLAERDIDSVLEYISVNLSNPKAAADLLAETENAIERVCAFPRAGTDCLRYLIADENIRYVPVGNYVLIYEIAEKMREIRVLRFAYSKMNQADI